MNCLLRFTYSKIFNHYSVILVAKMPRDAVGEDGDLPNGPTGGGIKIQTFRPTWEEFKDFNKFIQYMESQGRNVLIYLIIYNLYKI